MVSYALVEIQVGMGVRRILAGRMASWVNVSTWVENMDAKSIISINEFLMH